MISRAGNSVLKTLAGVDIHDFSANFRAIRKKAWEKLKIHKNTDLILFAMIIKAKYNGFKITELPVTFKERIYGKSKLNLLKAVPKAAFKSVVYLIKYRRFA